MVDLGDPKAVGTVNRRMVLAAAGGLLAFVLMGYAAGELFSAGAFSTVVGLLVGYAVAHGLYFLSGRGS